MGFAREPHIREYKCNCISFLCCPGVRAEVTTGLFFCIIFVMIVLHVSVVTPQDRHEYFIIPKCRCVSVHIVCIFCNANVCVRIYSEAAIWLLFS